MVEQDLLQKGGGAGKVGGDEQGRGSDLPVKGTVPHSAPVKPLELN